MYLEGYTRCTHALLGCIGTTTLQKLQKLQNRAARVATNSCFDSPSEPLKQQLGWLTIEQLIELETVRSFSQLSTLYRQEISSSFSVLSYFHIFSLLCVKFNFICAYIFIVFRGTLYLVFIY